MKIHSFPRLTALILFVFMVIFAAGSRVVTADDVAPISTPEITVERDQDADLSSAALAAKLDKSALTTGILHIPAISMLPAGDTTAGDMSNWYQAYFELRRSFLEPTTLPDTNELRRFAQQQADAGDIPLGVLHYAYDALRPDAVEAGLLAVEDGALVDVPQRTASPFVTRTLFSVAALTDHVYQGKPATFTLDSAYYFSNQDRPETWLVDLGDGSGIHEFNLGQSITANYATAGEATLTITAKFPDGRQLTSRSRIEIFPAVPTQPDISWENLVATIPYAGETAVYDAYIFLGNGNTQITRPLIFAEGFDFENNINWPEVLAIVGEYGLADTLLAEGYDLIILNFEDATTYVQRNSFALVDLIGRVIAERAGDEPLVVAGASMGGMVGRYALAWMEANGIDHETRTLVTFDTPHQSANIPLGIQFWIEFYADYNTDADFFRAALDAPAARQLLAYHHLSLPDPTQDPLRATMFAELAALGDYPAEPRLVAVANGSGAGPAGGQTGNSGQPMQPGNQIIDWEYYIFLVIDLVGNVWAVPDVQPQTRIFEGDFYIFAFFGDSLDVYAENTLPYDNAPGGFRPTQQQMSNFDPTYDFLGFTIELGNIETNFPNHAFVPTISAVDARQNNGLPMNLFHDMNNDAQILRRTPFDAIYFPASATNEEHVVVTAENAAFLNTQIQIAAEVTGSITPVNPPIVIPAGGGNFNYTLSLTNHMANSESAQAVIELRDGNGNLVKETFNRTINLGTLATFNRAMQQRVPAGLPAGTYTMLLTVTSSSSAVDTSSFIFEKLAQ